MKKLLFLGVWLLTGNCFAQTQTNKKLRAQLDTIMQVDQGVREFFDIETSEKRKDTLARLLGYQKDTLQKYQWSAMNKIDVADMAKIEPIIAQYGYPGKTLVGEPTNLAVFYVVQHSGKISKYYSLIEKAGKKGELPFTYVAMMLDRKLMNEHKEQMYGTQIMSTMVTDAQTGKKKMFRYVVPIKSPESVNQRRKEAGFDSTVEANAKRLGVDYKVYTYEQIADMKKFKEPIAN